MIKHLATYILLCFYWLKLDAQEGLRPLSSNINYIYGDLKPSYEIKRDPFFSAKTTTSSASLQLPFFEDFYYSSTQKYPDQNLWDDSLVYVNSGYPIAPPSIGVATFDGLNKHGYPYNPTSNLTASSPADTLTSKPINLYTAGSVTLQPIIDSVALSFYYQARGHGDNPELKDSLILDFYKPNQQAWDNRVWFAKGNSNPNVNDTVFKRAFVWVADSIIDTAYLQDGFRFRFRNSASIAGNFDHWHIDYVYLNRNRTRVDTVYNDQTIEMIPLSFLKNYSAMPREQFTIGDTIGRTFVRIKNNFSGTVNMNYNYHVLDKNNNLIHNAYPLGNSGQIDPYKPYGCSNDPNLSRPVTFSFSPPLTDTSDFTIKHFVYRNLNGGGGSSVDFVPQNDTVFQYQHFRNYYAFDDGSAEAGYYINGAGGMMSVKIVLNKPDSLRAVRIYFDPVGFVNSSYSFSLCVWSSNASLPSTLLYSNDTVFKTKFYNSGFKEFPEYKLTSPLSLPSGTFFIGFKQGVSSGITVGFDMNNDFHKAIYYNIGTGGWKQSDIPGALMIRPVFGDFVPAPVGIQELNQDSISFVVFPNPTNELLHIESSAFKENLSANLYDILGNEVHYSTLNSQHSTINVNELNNGIYFLILKEKNTIVHQQKIIISR